MTPEQRAWSRLSQAAPRARYEHVRSWEKHNARRRNFLAKVSRNDHGCWLWSGQAPNRRGQPYPLFGVKTDGVSVQRSAFAWMIDEFFPELRDNRPGRTAASCGNAVCVSPFHRSNRMTTRNVITADQAVEVYAAKGSDARAVASRFGISRNQVLAIWRGRNWSDVTGAQVPAPVSRKIPPEVTEAIASRRGTASARAVSREFGVSNHYVGRVWRTLDLSDKQTT